jgi:hypothetical protein
MTIIGIVAALAFLYPLRGLLVSLLDFLVFRAQTRRGRTVEIEVPDPAGNLVTIPLRPDNEESIRSFLRNAELVRSGRAKATC